MIPKELAKKIRYIEIYTSKAVNDILAGQYESVFKGRGMEFDEVREYTPGDEVRTIDWNVTARTGTPFVKRFCEERELTVLFVVDVSASGAFGTLHRSKLDLVVEVAALLMFSALKNNDKVGLVTFCDEVISYFPPRKGRSTVLHLIRQLVSVEPVARETDLAGGLDFLNRVQKRRAVVFLISDFLTVTSSVRSAWPTGATTWSRSGWSIPARSRCPRSASSTCSTPKRASRSRSIPAARRSAVRTPTGRRKSSSGWSRPSAAWASTTSAWTPVPRRGRAPVTTNSRTFSR